MNSSDIKIASSKKIIGNTFYSLISESSLLFTSIFYILAANHLREVAYGKFASALAFVGIFTLLVVFGFVYSITKFIVNDRKRAEIFIGNALYIQFVFSIVCFIGCYFIAFLFRNKYPLDVRYIIIIVFFAESFKCYNLTLRTALKALNEFLYPTIAVLIERCMLLLVGGFLLLKGYGIYSTAAVLLGSRILGFLLLIYFTIRIRHRLFLKPDFSVCKDLMRRSWIYVVQTIFGRFYDHIDVVMISLLRRFEEVGWYSAARRIFEGLWLIPNVITEAVYPELASRHLLSISHVSKLFDKSFKYMLTVSVIVSVGTILIARALIDLVYGQAYYNASTVLILLGIAVIPSFLRYLFGTTLIAIEMQKQETYISAGRSGFNIIANLLLIPFYGYLGATIATVATEYVSLIPYFVFFKRRKLIKKEQLKFIYKPFLAIIILIPVFFLINSVNIFIQFVIVIIFYGVIVFLLKIFQKEEVDILKNFFKGLLQKKKIKSDDI